MRHVLKVIHGPDVHISEKQRPTERRRAMGFILDLVESEQVDLVCWTGDWYDGTPSIADEEEGADYLVRGAGTCPQILIAGNHDPRGEIAKYNRLRTGLAPDSHRHPVYATEEPVWLEVAGFGIAAFPHFTTTQAAAALPPDTGIREKDQLAMAYVRQELDRFEAQVRAFHGPTLFLGHFDVEGAEDSGGEAYRSGAVRLTMADLNGVGASMVCLGHIHRPSHVYSGSVYHKTYGERDDAKSVVVATFDRLSGRLIERRQVPLPQTPMYKIEARLTDDGWQAVEKHYAIGAFEWPELAAKSEVWVDLEYPSDRKAEAETMAAEARRRYSDAQGLRVEPRAIPVVERRSQDFSSAQGLRGKYETWRAAEGDYSPIPLSVETKIDQIVGAVGDLPGASSSKADQGLVLGDLEFCGVNAVDKPIRVPYSTMRGVIGLAGPIGSGKTTTFEASFAALTRGFAYYGSNIADRCHGNAYITQEFQMGGHQYAATIRVRADLKTPAVEAEITRDGVPLYKDPKKLGNFDSAIREIVGTPETLEFTVFARQLGSKSLTKILPAERTERIMELTGGEIYQRASEFASVQAKALQEPIAESRTTADEFTRRLADLGPLEASLATKTREVEEDAKALAVADEAVRKAIHAEAEIAALPEGVGAAERELAEKSDRRQALRDQYADLTTKLKAEEETAGKRAGVEAAAARVDALEAELADERQLLTGMEEAQATLLRLKDEYQSLQVDLAEKRAALQRHQDQVTQARQEEQRTAGAAVKNAEAEVASLEESIRIVDVGAPVVAAEREVIHQESLVASARQQLGDLKARTAIIDRVPCAGLEINATCELLGSARKDRDGEPAAMEALAAAEAKKVELEGAVARAQADQASQRDGLAQALQVAQQGAEASRAALQIIQQVTPFPSVVEQGLSDEVLAVEACLHDAAFDGDALVRITANIPAMRGRIADLQGQLDGARILAAQLPAVEAAERRKADLEGERAKVQQEGEALKAECDELQRRIDGLAQHERLLADAKAKREDAQRQRDDLDIGHRKLQAAWGALRGQIEQLEALRPLLEEANIKLLGLSAAHAEWKLLERGFGKAGCQALAVDEAGPEIADHVNGILRDSGYSQWTFGLVTQVEKADGKGVKDRFEPQIFHRGEQQDIVSGGQGAILDIAIRLGIVAYNAAHSVRTYQVMWLDEIGQPLGVADSEAFVKMLRRTREREMGGFVQILVTSHRPEVHRLCDWLITMEPRDHDNAIRSVECLTAQAAMSPAREAVLA